jgi:hypothetical protein
MRRYLLPEASVPRAKFEGRRRAHWDAVIGAPVTAGARCSHRPRWKHRPRRLPRNRKPQPAWGPPRAKLGVDSSSGGFVTSITAAPPEST